MERHALPKEPRHLRVAIVLGVLLLSGGPLFAQDGNIPDTSHHKIVPVTVNDITPIYINEILFFFVSAHYFNKIVKPMGYSFRDAWRFKWTSPTNRSAPQPPRMQWMACTSGSANIALMSAARSSSRPAK